MSEIPWIMEFNMELLLGDMHSNLKFMNEVLPNW